MEEKKLVGKKISELRRANGFTQKNVAELLGVAQGSVSYWEHGKVKIHDYWLGKLADLYCVDKELLLGNADDEYVEDVVSREWHDEQVLILLRERDNLADYVKILKKEVDDLTEEIEYLKQHADQFLADYQKAQKQVDELTDKLGKVLSTVGINEYQQSKAVEQAVKDTAKEIFDFAKGFFTWDEEGFVGELKELVQDYGVEVE